MNTYLEPVDEAWRGLGIIKESGLDLRNDYSYLNAKKNLK